MIKVVHLQAKTIDNINLLKFIKFILKQRDEITQKIVKFLIENKKLRKIADFILNNEI